MIYDIKIIIYLKIYLNKTEIFLFEQYSKSENLYEIVDFGRTTKETDK